MVGWGCERKKKKEQSSGAMGSPLIDPIPGERKIKKRALRRYAPHFQKNHGKEKQVREEGKERKISRCGAAKVLARQRASLSRQSQAERQRQISPVWYRYRVGFVQCREGSVPGIGPAL